MQGSFIEDRGQPNPRQAEVDRLRDAAARSMKAKSAKPTVVLDDVSIGTAPVASRQSIRPVRTDDGGATQAQP